MCKWLLDLLGLLYHTVVDSCWLTVRYVQSDTQESIKIFNLSLYSTAWAYIASYINDYVAQVTYNQVQQFWISRPASQFVHKITPYA